MNMLRVRSGRVLDEDAKSAAVDAAILDIMAKAKTRLRGEPSHALVIVDRRKNKTVVMAMVGRAS
jgi:hypothetical protein